MAGLSAQRPDFVMVGGQQDGQVYLLASRTLTEVELRMEAEWPDYLTRHRYRSFQPIQRHFVTAEMRDYVMVVADSYAEAFRTLFEQWTPGAGEQPAVENRPAIAAAPPKMLP